MKVVDIRAFQPYLSPGLPCFQDQNIPGYSGPIEGIFIMKVVDIRAFQPYLSPGLPCFQDQNIPGHFGPTERIFIMKVVDIRAFSTLFVACIALFSRSEYTGVF